MSAALDALTSGGYGEYGVVAPTSDASSVGYGIGADYFSGALQTLTSLGTGYLSKRMDIDLTSRLYGNQPLPRTMTTQNPVQGYGTVVRAQNGQQVAQLNLSLLGPLLVVGVIAYMVAKRG